MWCALTGLQNELPDLVAAVRNADRAYLEWGRLSSRAAQERTAEIEGAAKRIQGFETHFVPGLLQTESYARAVLSECIAKAGTGEDVEAAVKVRMYRQHMIRRRQCPLHLIIAEEVLYIGRGGAQVMREQLSFLADCTGVMSWFNFGILPKGTANHVQTSGFWMYDGREVWLEMASAGYGISRQSEVLAYQQMFGELAEQSVTGRDALRLVHRAAAALPL